MYCLKKKSKFFLKRFCVPKDTRILPKVHKGRIVKYQLTSTLCVSHVEGNWITQHFLYLPAQWNINQRKGGFIRVVAKRESHYLGKESSWLPSPVKGSNAKEVLKKNQSSNQPGYWLLEENKEHLKIMFTEHKRILEILQVWFQTATKEQISQ